MLFPYKYLEAITCQARGISLPGRKMSRNSNTRIVAALSGVLILSVNFAIHGVDGGSINCEELPVEACAFSVSSGGNRCVLEKGVVKDGTMQFQCQSSVIMAEGMLDWVESEECVSACGLERMSVGMSTDSLLEPNFATKLCSAKCQNNCPNIVDLYLNLAEGEGISLSSLCAAQRSRSRRLIASVLSAAKSSTFTTEAFPPHFGIDAAAPAPAL